MNIYENVDQVRSIYASGQATENTDRPALIGPFQSIEPTPTAMDELTKLEAGMPVFTLYNC